ncbi:hypothetical protein HanRHA438_Chr07g0326901 [Helianthus annuus]|nr:hypothetical protein HanHA300_Chr07g0261421 [Helianthus annuus]KAJ0558934.1 hypothetical protein HanIR_Chr07g0341831 [Helianthus annuus]KAJ0909937.1 hypothetical protein HanRHA438_Chr07g0326901 [Helianthus annuus]
MASAIVLHVPLPSLDTTISAWIPATGACSSLLSSLLNHFGNDINLLRRCCIGTPLKSSPAAAYIAKQLLTNSDKSFSFSSICCLTYPFSTSDNPSAHVS